MAWHARIAIDPNVLAGKPVVRGTRIAVEFVIELLARGWTAEEVLAEYDPLQPGEVQACLAYAHDVLAAERVYPTPAGS